jgi:sortase A
VALTVAAALVVTGCAAAPGTVGAADPGSEASAGSTTDQPASAGSTDPAPGTEGSPDAQSSSDDDRSPGTGSPEDEASGVATPIRLPDPRRSFLTVPALGLVDLPVVRYRGRPDDAPGTAIQNSGPAASPRGPRGGVGPGDVGNFIVTGHRSSHTMPFADLPSLRPGARVRVRAADTVYVYEITRTRQTSFRSPASLRAQVAPVPGRPGVAARHAFITLSTCATPEDHAAGNYWSDEFGNPEHRIDKIGRLVDVRLPDQGR